MENTKTEKIQERIEELDHIKEEIRYLVQEALAVAGDDDTAKRTWFARILTALDDDHEFLGKASHTIQDTIDELIEKLNE